MITIKEVKTRKQGKLFTNFPNKLFKDVPSFVPALSIDENNVFNPKTNPTHDYVKSVRFLAYKNNKLVGRIAGLIQHKINYETNVKQVRFTRLDMIDDIEVTKTLLNAVETWGKENFGMNEIIGPIGFTDFDRQGMLVEGFDHLNMFITIYNAPYYKDHMEQLGYTKAVDWLEKKITWPAEVPEKVTRASAMVQKRFGYRLYKPSKLKDLDGFVHEAFDVYNKAFSDLYGFYPVSRPVVEFYINQAKTFLNLDWVWVVYDKDDKIAGFGVIMPSFAKANKKNNGKLLPFGWVRMLRALKHYDTIDFYFIAVSPEHQNKGVSALLFEDAIKMGIDKKVKFAETGPELEENFAIQSFWKDFDYEEHKRRRCWIKKI